MVPESKRCYRGNRRSLVPTLNIFCVWAAADGVEYFGIIVTLGPHLIGCAWGLLDESILSAAHVQHARLAERERHCSRIAPW